MIPSQLFSKSYNSSLISSPRPFAPHINVARTPAPRPHRQLTTRAQDGDQTPPAKRSKNPLAGYRPPSKEEADLRAEAEAPFRSIRMVLFGFGSASAGLATLLSLPTLIGALAGAPNAKPLLEAGQDFGINIGALLFLGFFLVRDLEARDKQLLRLMREDALGACQLELSNKRCLRLAQLRGAARPVLFAGSPSQVAAALEAAEPFKDALKQRGVLVIGLPIFADAAGTDAPAAQLPALVKDDLRWRAVPIRIDAWKQWFNEQAADAGKGVERGLYVGLRKDGRVRASGLGCPPWGAFAAQLPVDDDGMWGGFLDGMDGVVGGG